VLIAVLFHTFSNIAGAAIPYWTTSEGRWVSFGFLLLFASLVVVFSAQFRSTEQKSTA
jgi:hypothetical protein